jgi:hypothetical protein
MTDQQTPSAEPTETSSLLHSTYDNERKDSSLLEDATLLRSHDRSDSIIPDFVFTSIENVEEVFHDLVTFEPLDVEELVETFETEREAEGEPQLTIAEEAEEITELIHPTDPMDPFKSDEGEGPPEKLGMIPLAVMVFYSVSGGPFGCETSVRAGGNFYALLGFLIMPCVWAMQEALLTAELGTTFPEASGGVAWVEEGFGINAGWMSGYLGWIAGATDNAIYPVLFMDYLLQALHMDKGEFNPVLRFCILAVTSSILGYVNWLGLPIVGKMSVTISVVVSNCSCLLGHSLPRMKLT